MRLHASLTMLSRPDKSRSRGACLRLTEVLFVFAVVIRLGLHTLQRTHQLYLTPYLEQLQWTVDREAMEGTYYRRSCQVEDISTHNASDLFLSPHEDDDIEATQKAYDIFLEHGFVVFPDVIPPAVAQNLREFILRHNYEQDPTGIQGELLHSPKHRWLAEFHPGDDSSVNPALESIANDPVLRRTITKIFGFNPSLLEFNAITSAPGAGAQDWHRDGTSHLLQFSHSFAPTHVLLLQLQDTTLDMGPTRICPGTHMCTKEYATAMDACDEANYGRGIPAVNGSGIFPAGSAMLMNTNALHHGSSYLENDHSDMHRVMLVLTLVPRRLERGESRQVTQELSYTMRWPLLGHSWNDFGHFWLPSGYLNALGLRWNDAKNKNGGVYDWFQLLLQRLAATNPTTCDDYLDMLGWSSAWWEEDEDAEKMRWAECCDQMIDATIDRAMMTLKVLLCIYVALLGRNTSPKSTSVRSQSLSRCLIGCCLAAAGVAWINFRMLDESAMMTDIANGQLGVVSTSNQRREFDGLSTLPKRSDMLIESRLGAKHLGMYNDQIQYHPGNREWKAFIEYYAPYYHSKYPASLQPSLLHQFLLDFSLKDVVNVDEKSGKVQCYNKPNRILYQGPTFGSWLLLSRSDTLNVVAKAIELTPLQESMQSAVRRINAECLHGFRKHTALCRKHAHMSPKIDALRAFPLFDSSFSQEKTVSSSTNVAARLPGWFAANVPSVLRRDHQPLHRAQRMPSTPKLWHDTCNDEALESEHHLSDFVQGGKVLCRRDGGDAVFEAIIDDITSSRLCLVHFSGDQVEDIAQLEDLIAWSPVQAGQLAHFNGALHTVESILLSVDDEDLCLLRGETNPVDCSKLNREMEKLSIGDKVLAYRASVEEDDGDHASGWYAATIDSLVGPLHVAWVEWYDKTQTQVDWSLLLPYREPRLTEIVTLHDQSLGVIIDVYQETIEIDDNDEEEEDGQEEGQADEEGEYLIVTTCELEIDLLDDDTTSVVANCDELQRFPDQRSGGHFVEEEQDSADEGEDRDNSEDEEEDDSEDENQDDSEDEDWDGEAE